MKFLTRTILSLLLTAITFSTLSAQTSWTKWPGNPVVAAWNNNIDNAATVKYAFEPCVLYDWTTGVYRMWYTSLAFGYGTAFSVNGAMSLNGTDWFIQNDGPALNATATTGAFDLSVRNPKVLSTDNGYFMYYVGTDANGRGEIGLATSQDGMHFTKHGSTPVLSGGSAEAWDFGGAGFQDVRKEDSTYFMWYSSSSGSVTSIGLATSTDGVSWVKNDSNPVLSPALPSEASTVLQPSVVKVGLTYYMFYLAGPYPGRAVYCAYSVDKVHWTRVSDNPVLTGASEGWEGTTIGGLSVFYFAGEFHMWYSAVSPSTGQWQIGYATSTMVPLGVVKAQGTTSAMSLSQNFPNPFNPSTTIRFNLPSSQKVLIKVFDDLGRQVATLVDGQLQAGNHTITWDGSKYASGTYICRLIAGDLQQTRTMVLVK